METGFGSPIFSPLDDYADWGHGSSVLNFTTFSFQYTGVRGRDTGFGSPFDIGSSPVYIDGERDVLPDSGNVTLRIGGEWTRFLDVKPPVRGGGFTVYFVNYLTSEEYVGIGLFANNCFTDYRHEFLEVRVPPLPIAPYSIRIECPTQVDIIYIDNAFRTVVSPRCETTYSLRSYLPSWLAKGAVDFQGEEIAQYQADTNLGVEVQLL